MEAAPPMEVGPIRLSVGDFSLKWASLARRFPD